MKDLILKNKTVGEIPQNSAQNFMERKLDFLCDYIVNTHHQTMEKLLPQILTYKLLQEFKVDLHIHVPIENNILYPKAMKL